MDLLCRELVWYMLAVRVEHCEASMSPDLMASLGKTIRMTSLYHQGGAKLQERAASPPLFP